MPGLSFQRLLCSEISSPAHSHVPLCLGEPWCISGESIAPSCVTKALLVLAPMNPLAILCIRTPHLQAQTHPTCTINSLENCSASGSSCSLLFFMPPACIRCFPGCKVTDQYLKTETNGARRADEVSFPQRALGQTLYRDIFAGRQEKSAVTYGCNSAPDEAAPFEVSKYIWSQSGRIAFLTFYEPKLFIIPKKRTI